MTFNDIRLIFVCLNMPTWIKILLFCFYSFVYQAGNAQFTRNTDHIYKKVNVAPTFEYQGMGLQEYIAKNLKVSEHMESDIVKLEFDVLNDGTILNWSFIKKSKNPYNNWSAVNLFLNMPKWTPGYNEEGKPLSAKGEMEIVFNPKTWNYYDLDDIPEPPDASKLPNKTMGKIHDIAAVDPVYPGGGEALKAFIQENLEYPIEVPEFHGSIYVQFVIWKDGYFGNFSIRKGDYKVYNKAAIEVLEKMTKWIPGKNKAGQPINVRHTLPVHFE